MLQPYQSYSNGRYMSVHTVGGIRQAGSGDCFDITFVPIAQYFAVQQVRIASLDYDFKKKKKRCQSNEKTAGIVSTKCSSRSNR